jgi:hypothetical protein
MTSIQIDIKDGLSSSVAIKGPCRVATTANITLSGEQTIDGVAVVTDDRVLVKDQTTGSENGIYVVDTGTWRRSKDFNKSKDIKTGTMVNVVSGSTGSGWWEVTTTGDITVGTTSIAFAQRLQPYDADLASWAGVTRAADFDTFVTTPSSDNLRALLTDETGTGANVFANTPTLVTPIIGNATGTSLNESNGSLAVTVTPTGNASSTKSVASFQSSTTSNTDRDFALNVGLVSGHGAGQTTPAGDKVALYAGIDALNGTGSMWAANFLVGMGAATGNYNAQGIEVDINNLNVDRGDTDGSAGLAQPSIYGATVTGASTKRITAALGVFSSLKMFNRGIVFANDCINQSTVQDLTNAPVSLDIRGTHTYGLDLKNGTFTTPIRLGNNTVLRWRNASDSGDQAVLSLDGSNNVIFGGAALAGEYRMTAFQDAAMASLRIHNTSNSGVTTKLVGTTFYGRDTVSSDKEAARIEINPLDSNWVSSDAVFYGRLSDAVVERLRLRSNGEVKLPTISALGTAAVGNLEFDGKAFYANAAASSRQVIPARQIVTVQGSTVALSNSSTSAQNIFASANDVLTVQAATTYRFRARMSFNTGATSHTTAFGFGGTATFTTCFYNSIATSSAAGTLSTPQMARWNSAAANVVTAASTAITTDIILDGIIRINAAGTVIPQITFSAGPTGTCETALDSYFELEAIGSNTVAAIGNWA